MSEITDKAKKLLSEATPGEWRVDDTEDGALIVRPPGVTKWVCSFGYMDEVEADDLQNAEFIAAAPGLVRGLLAENAKLRKALVLIIPVDKSSYKHHEPRPDGLRPSSDGGTIWLTPKEIAVEVLEELR